MWINNLSPSCSSDIHNMWIPRSPPMVKGGRKGTEVLKCLDLELVSYPLTSICENSVSWPPSWPWGAWAMSYPVCPERAEKMVRPFPLWRSVWTARRFLQGTISCFFIEHSAVVHDGLLTLSAPIEPRGGQDLKPVCLAFPVFKAVNI